MDHPLINLSDSARMLRERVIHLFRNGLEARLESPFVFICGGKLDGDYQRPKFIDFLNRNKPKFVPILPELAIPKLYDLKSKKAFNISRFEEYISEISFCVLIFPESPGSFAETGLFSGKGAIRKKSLIVSERRFSNERSFLSLGPFKTVSDSSIFPNPLYLDFDEEGYQMISQEIENEMGSRRWKEYSFQKNSINEVELLGIISWLIDIIKRARSEEIEFFMRILTGNSQKVRIAKALSILSGSKLISEDLDYGYYKSIKNLDFFRPRNGFRNASNKIRLDIISYLISEGFNLDNF